LSAAAPRVLLGCDHFVKYAAGLGGGLSELGCDVALLTRSHPLEFGGEPGAMEEHVRRAGGGRLRHERLQGRVRDPGALPAVPRMRGTVRAFGPAVVHLQDSVVNDVRLIAASGARRGRFALTVHDVHQHPGDRRRAGWKRRLRRYLVRSAGVVFVHGDALRDELVRREEPRGPVVVVPHGADVPPPAPLPERPALLFFGRISHYKGLDTLLDAMPLVWERIPDLTLTIAGEGRLPDHESLSDARVDVQVGHVPEERLDALFAGATCVVLPYREASQSGVGSIALGRGRAVVATRVGALPELVGPEVGRLVPPESPEPLAEAIVEVVATPGLAADMGRAGREAAEAGASWRRVAELTLAAYRRHLLPTRQPAA
jgi:glycosyltransferase involved in cell wall biosynthesis